MKDIKNEIIELLRSTNREGIEKLISAMEEGGFFTAPCSGSYHLAKEGGLAEHSLNVYHAMKNVTEAMCVGAAITDENIIICSILHDLGKMGAYGKPNYIPNILKNGQQSSSKPYETNKELAYIPHEVRSLEIAEKYIALSEDEAHAIYYHNGKYTHIGYDLKETPLQMLLHFADLWSSRVTEEDVSDC